MIKCGSANKTYDDENLSSMIDYCAFISKMSKAETIYVFSQFVVKLDREDGVDIDTMSTNEIAHMFVEFIERTTK